MSIDYGELDVGTVPGDEPCEQLGENYHPTKARAECYRFIDLLVKKFGVAPPGVEFKVRSNPHDFGSYFSVVIRFEERPDCIAYAYCVEGNLPATWSDETPVDVKAWSEKRQQDRAAHELLQ